MCNVCMEAICCVLNDTLQSHLKRVMLLVIILIIYLDRKCEKGSLCRRVLRIHETGLIKSTRLTVLQTSG